MLSGHSCQKKAKTANCVFVHAYLLYDCVYPSTQHIIDLEQMVKPSEDTNARSENV